MAEDVYQALNEVGFDKYTTQLKEFMSHYDQEKEENRLNKVAGNIAVKRNIDLIEDQELDEGESKKIKYSEE